MTPSALKAYSVRHAVGMKKYIIGFVLIIITPLGYLMYKAETVDYTKVVNNEINHFDIEP